MLVLSIYYSPIMNNVPDPVDLSFRGVAEIYLLIGTKLRMAQSYFACLLEEEKTLSITFFSFRLIYIKCYAGPSFEPFCKKDS